jgi:anaerobic selenocysteine-containing dehydrogenase
MGKIDTVVYLNTSLNTGHASGVGAEETIILPVLARDEEPEPSTQESMFSYIRLSDGGKPRHVGPRAEVEIVADLATRVLGQGGPVDWRAMSHTSTIREAIAAIVPGLEQIAEIDRSKKEFSIPGRAIDTPAFPTADGKATLFVHDLPPAPQGLTLMTIRSEGQFNTVVYEEEDLYRNQTRRDIVMIHPDDVRRYGLTDGGRCRIASTAGEMRGQIVAAYDQIRQGCVAMYYPESNVLVPKAADPLSRTPAYKNVAVTIAADDAAAVAVRPAPELVGAGTPRDKMNQCG